MIRNMHVLYYGFRETSVLLDVLLLSDEQIVQSNFKIPYFLSKVYISLFKVQSAQKKYFLWNILDHYSYKVFLNKIHLTIHKILNTHCQQFWKEKWALIKKTAKITHIFTTHKITSLNILPYLFPDFFKRNACACVIFSTNSKLCSYIHSFNVSNIVNILLNIFKNITSNDCMLAHYQMLWFLLIFNCYK